MTLRGWWSLDCWQADCIEFSWFKYSIVLFIFRHTTLTTYSSCRSAAYRLSTGNALLEELLVVWRNPKAPVQVNFQFHFNYVNFKRLNFQARLFNGVTIQINPSCDNSPDYCFTYPCTTCCWPTLWKVSFAWEILICIIRLSLCHSQEFNAIRRLPVTFEPAYGSKVQGFVDNSEMFSEKKPFRCCPH